MITMNFSDCVRVCPTQCPTGSRTTVSIAPYRGARHSVVAWVRSEAWGCDTPKASAAKLKALTSRNARPRPRTAAKTPANPASPDVLQLDADPQASAPLNAKSAERQHVPIGAVTRCQVAISSADQGKNGAGRSLAGDRLAFGTTRLDLLSRTCEACP